MTLKKNYYVIEWITTFDLQLESVKRQVETYV